MFRGKNLLIHVRAASRRSFSHIPVLLRESLAGLRVGDGKCFVDCTYGGGGHTSAIVRSCLHLMSFSRRFWYFQLEACSTSRVLALDVDKQAVFSDHTRSLVRRFGSDRLSVAQSAFSDLEEKLKEFGYFFVVTSVSLRHAVGFRGKWMVFCLIWVFRRSSWTRPFEVFRSATVTTDRWYAELFATLSHSLPFSLSLSLSLSFSLFLALACVSVYLSLSPLSLSSPVFLLRLSLLTAVFDRTCG